MATDSEWVDGFGLELKLPPEIQQVLDKIDAVLSYGITLLELADLILSVMQSLLAGLLDPIRAIVEALLDELRALIKDLINTGVYINGDFKLLTPDNYFADLVGGYAAYEQRMMARLIDRTDLNRPDFAPTTPTVGFFFYMTDGENVSKVVKAITALMALFGPFGRGAENFPPTTTPKAEVKDDSVKLSWAAAQVAGAVQGLAAPAPAGFVIEVSTLPRGLRVVALGTDDGHSPSGSPAKIPSICLDPQSGAPLYLYGGIGAAGVGPDGDQWESVETGPQQLRFQIDQANPLIKPSDLRQGDKPPLLGTAFYVKAGVFTQLLPGQSFTTLIHRDLLPKGASFDSDGSPNIIEDTRSYFFRVRAVGPDLATAIEDAMGVGITDIGNAVPMYGKAARLFYLSTTGIRSSVNARKFYPDAFAGTVNSTLRCTTFSAASSSVSVTLPSADVLNYRRVLQAAAMIAILGRLDLKAAPDSNFAVNRVSPGQETGSEEFISRLLVRYGWFAQNSPATQAKFRNINAFRSAVLSASKAIAVNLEQLNPPTEEMVQLISDLGAPLMGLRFAATPNGNPDRDIFQLMEMKNTQWGVAPRISALLLDGDSGPPRGPAFMLPEGVSDADLWVPGVGSVDGAPILYWGSDSSKLKFFRNYAQEQGVVPVAANVLRLAGGVLARPQTDAQWIALRIFPQNLTPFVDILNSIEEFMGGVLDGLQSIIDAVLRVIQSIRARLNQLQALLEMIRSYLRILGSFVIPPMSVLFTVGDGTNGLLGNFLNAENKPTGGPEAYSAGMVIVAGGINRFLLGLLQP